jgi:hypothetical protein
MRRFFFPIEAEHIDSLSILCQGYLTVWASWCNSMSHLLTDQENEVMKSVEELDLTNILDIKDVSLKFREIQNASWWDVFEEPDSSTTPEEKATRLKENLRNELGISSTQGLPQALNALVDAIAGGSVKEPVLVINALIELTEYQ